MTDRKAMEKALEALEYTHEVFGLTPRGMAAKTALHERLAQPEQEPEYDWEAEYAKRVELHNQTLDELRDALVQPEQKPEYKGWYCAHCQRGVDASEVTYHEQHIVCGRVITDDSPPNWDSLSRDNEQQEQEPFAWVDESAIRWLADRKGKTSAHCTTQLSAARSCEQSMPIYTTPQRREWVGLTEEEIWGSASTGNDGQSFGDLHWQDCTLPFARALEAKLKEKNNG